MRKLFSLFLTLVATANLWAYDFKSGDLYYNITSSFAPYTVEVTYERYKSSSNYYGLYSAVTIPSTVRYNGTTYSVTSIGDQAFAGCSSLTSVTIPESVTSIGGAAFYECSSLTSITIPNSVTSIRWEAFAGCSSLTSVTIPESVTSIGRGAFAGCTSLTSITIPNSVTSIESSAFSDCSSLTSITIPNSVTSIGNGAFDSCSSLTSVTIGNSVTSIGYEAFDGCSSLTSITIPESVTSIGGWAFYDTGIYYDESNWENNVLYIDNCLICANTSISSSYTIKENTRLIADYAFSDCSSLTSVTIGNSVTSIGDRAFDGCSSLTSMVVAEGNTVFDSRENCNALIHTATNALVAGCKNTIIPNSVTSIGNYAFDGCSKLTAITIPESVTSIGNGAFSDCDSLASITCEATTPPTLGSSVFYGVSISIPVYVPCGSENAYKAASGWKEFTNIQEPQVEYAIQVSTSNSQMGTAIVNYNSCAGNQISATPNIGYHFVKWSDGNTDAIRTLELTQDTILTAEFAINQYTITTVSSDTQRGTTKGDTTVNYLEYITISATASYGYHFTQWNDANVENPRQVQVTGDATYIATFDKNTYAISLSCNEEQGSVEGVTSAEYLDTVTISATPNIGYHFVQWSDGITDNPRTLELTQDTILIAEFAQSFSGQCGDNLYWSYDETAKTVSITGSGKMYDYTADTQPWFLFKEQIVEVTTNNTVTSIGTSAFEGCVRLAKISLGTGLEEIAANAFAGCTRLYDIYTYATYPPFAEESSFANYNVYVYVPCESKRDYTMDPVWSKFQNIECLSDEPITGVENIETPSQATTNCQKIIRNGQLIIIRDGVEYTVMGQEM